MGRGGARKGASPSGPAADFAARLAAAMDYKGWGVLELAARSHVGRNSVAAHLRPKGDRLPTARIRRKYTDALGLGPLTLDQGTPAEIVAQMQVARLRVTTVEPASFPASEGDVVGTLAFVRAQLDGYRQAGRLIRWQVAAVWLDEIEAAVSAAAPAPAPDIAGSGSAPPATARPRQAGAAP